MKDFNRDYGLPQGEATGIPKATLVTDPKLPCCPNCGCKEMMEIKVPMNQRLLKGQKGIGTYIGCPACPFASPCLVVAS